MPETPHDPRRDRLRAALRENLKRRKAQARTRAVEGDGEPGHDGAGTRRDRQGPRGD